MKPFLTTISLLASLLFYGQHTPEEIKKYKIASAAETCSFKEDGVPQKFTYTAFYDRNGNDTAYYHDKLCIYRKIYTQDDSNRISMVIMQDKDGKESERTEYTYEANGNYSTKNRHKVFEAVIIKWYDKTGRLLKQQRDEETTLIYKYNSKGQVMQVVTKFIPGGKGEIEHLKYTYNSKGQCIKEQSLGTYPWVKTLFYDTKGVLIKTITTGKEAGQTYTTTNTYQYTFWK